MASTAAGGIAVSDLISGRLALLEELTIERTKEIVREFADQAEQYAQDNAPWEDRTGEARDGLTGVMQEEGMEIELILYNESEHGIWLEIAMSQRYQIIMPTLDHIGPELMAALAAGLWV